MGAEQSIGIVREAIEASQRQDWDRYRELLAEDATFRAAGVPRAIGGVLEGRDAIIEQTRQNAAQGALEIKEIFGDESRVCVIAKLTSPTFAGNRFLRGTDRPFKTWEAIVYQVEGGRITGSTAYVNWMDVYVQTGLIDTANITATGASISSR